MSNSKKKTYKKRKPSTSGAKKNANAKPESKVAKFLHNWDWLIIFIAIVLIIVSAFVFIPMCDSCATDCANSCKTSSSTDLTNIPDGYTDQMKEPAEGEEVAVLETSMGNIVLRLFPDKAPKTVENFKGLINRGYYDGVIFHRVMNQFMIQSGDPTGTGYGGESIWGEDFEDEFDNGLYNFRGALSMANTGEEGTNSSQFFIVQNSRIGESVTEEVLKSSGLPDWAAKYYQMVGGSPTLDRKAAQTIGNCGHTVFGQVVSGMDVVDAIAAVETDTKTNKPIDDVLIIKAYLTEYHRGMLFNGNVSSDTDGAASNTDAS